MSDQNEDMEKNLSISLSDEVAGGTYANFSITSHSYNEFFIDFIQFVPGMQKGRVQCRVVMAPQNFKELTNMMSSDVKGYEKRYGEIKQREEGKTTKIGIPIHFGAENTEA